MARAGLSGTKPASAALAGGPGASEELGPVPAGTHMGTKRRLCWPFEKSWTASDSRRLLAVEQPNSLLPGASEV